MLSQYATVAIEEVEADVARAVTVVGLVVVVVVARQRRHQHQD